jgi:hypothetical protein
MRRATGLRLGVLFVLLPVIVAQQNVQYVSDAEGFAAAVEQGMRHIIIRQHLNLTTLQSPEPGTPKSALVVSPTTHSIRVRTRDSVSVPCMTFNRVHGRPNHATRCCIVCNTFNSVTAYISFREALFELRPGNQAHSSTCYSRYLTACTLDRNAESVLSSKLW